MRNKKGFTLVELLAVVVILGILISISIPVVNRWIDRSKTESDEGNKKTLVMAAQSYAQGNSKKLPKVVGGTTKITATELKDANFLKEDLQNSDKKNCMDSYVKVEKTSKGQYKYTAYIYCEGDTVTAESTETKPIITIFFYGEKNEDGQVDDVKISAFRITIEGGNTSSKKYTLASYSYSISARYTGNGNDKVVEIFNTGNVEANQQERIIIEKSLEEYTDITKVNDFIITAEAYNSIGGYRKQTASSSYKDSVPPKCGKITNQANEGEWTTTPKSRTISVACSDGDGSGCVKDVFTKTFDTEMEYGYITISDNAGNTTSCKVRVLHDWTKPTLKITAYALNANNTRGKQESDTKEAKQGSASATIDTYYDAVNGWLNIANFPGGVEYVIQTSDNIKLDQGRWYENSPGIYSLGASNLSSLHALSPSNFTTNSNTVSIKISQAGLRRGKYTLKDAAGNNVVINMKADIDHNKPDIRTSKSHTGHTNGVHVTVYCTDNQSGCLNAASETLKGIKASANYTVTDRAGNVSDPSYVAVSAVQCHCSSCYTGENTCKYGCDQCMSCPTSCMESHGECHNDMGFACYKNYYSCRCSNCHTGHNTCAWGCDTCYN